MLNGAIRMDFTGKMTCAHTDASGGRGHQEASGVAATEAVGGGRSYEAWRAIVGILAIFCVRALMGSHCRILSKMT